MEKIKIDDQFLSILVESQKDGLVFLSEYDLGKADAPQLSPSQDVEFLTVDNVKSIFAKIDTVKDGHFHVRSEHLLESALARPLQAACYTDASVYELAAILAEGIVRDHPFTDGNKRTAHLCICAMLTINGLPCPEDSLRTSTIVLDLALRKLTVEDAGRYLALCRGKRLMDENSCTQSLKM